MSEVSIGVAGYPLIDVELVGGPDDLPNAIRWQKAAGQTCTIKIMHRGGYEHFERVDRAISPDQAASAVFHWKMRTEMAE